MNSTMMDTPWSGALRKEAVGVCCDPGFSGAVLFRIARDRIFCQKVQRWRCNGSAIRFLSLLLYGDIYQ